jgi:hypothetical protein
MKAPAKKLSGSAWQRINQIVTGSGKFSPKQIAKRRQFRRKGGNAL